MDQDVSLVDATVLFLGVPRSKIKVKLHKDNSREHLPSNESNIDRIWELRRKQNPKLYNGSKFRFHSIEMDHSCGGEVTFCLGLTGYKDFIGTNWANNAPELLEAGKRDFCNSQAYMSDPLGVGALVLTADDCAVFIRRSCHVGEAQGLWDIPGGHPEPAEVKGGATKMEDITLSNISELDVSKEISDSIIREIRDEINIPASKLGEPLLMGLVKNHTSSGRPCAEFLVKCSLHSSDVRALYKAGGSEAEESTGLALIPLSDLCTLEVTEMWKEMAPAAKGCVKLYTIMMRHVTSTEQPQVM